MEVEKEMVGRIGSIGVQTNMNSRVGRVEVGREMLSEGRTADTMNRQELESLFREIMTDASSGSFSGFRSGSFSGFRSEDLRRYRSFRREGLQVEDTERVEVREQSMHEERERVRIYEGPVTRSRGPVLDCEWVLRKAI